jgi:hypothetical protein
MLSYSQSDTVLTYRQKEVHNMFISKDTTSLTWTIDTIQYQVPFEIKLTKKSIAVDGYGTFKIDSVKKSEDGDYFNYYCPNKIQFNFAAGNAYLLYPMVARKSKVIVFYISSQ